MGYFFARTPGTREENEMVSQYSVVKPDVTVTVELDTGEAALVADSSLKKRVKWMLRWAGTSRQNLLIFTLRYKRSRWHLQAQSIGYLPTTLWLRIKDERSEGDEIPF